MNNRMETLMGLVSSGKRIYRVEEEQVTKDEFEAQQIIHELVFGERGLADTLGPTWAMIHDPRFEKIEASFIRNRKAYFGGDTTTGLNRQTKNGTFSTSGEDLNQYAELLGEGRYFHLVLRSMAYYKAVHSTFPDRLFRYEKGDYNPGITVFNQLSPEEQSGVRQLAATYSEYNPHNLHQQSDESIWGLIKQECPNYFNPHRDMEPNQVAKDLFSLLKADLVGLIDDYAEIARVQEWVLLDEESTLVEQHHIDADEPRAWLEVELLERALTLRASLRVSAAQILKTIGLQTLIAGLELQLTEFELDHLLSLIYSSKYPDGKIELISQVSSFLLAIKATGLTLDQRNREQTDKASAEARYFVEKLRSGEELPINRETDKGLDSPQTVEAQIASDIIADPLKLMLLLRLTDAESRLSLDSGVVTVISQNVPGKDLKKVCSILLPVFEKPDYVLTEEKASELLTECERYDPTLQFNLKEEPSEPNT